MSKFGIQAVKMNAVQFSGTKGYVLSPGRDVKSEGSDGTVNETMHSVMQMKRIADLTSRAARTWLTALNDSTDLPMKVLDGANGLQMYGAKASNAAPGYASGTVHHMRQGLNGLIYMAGLKWTLGDYVDMMLRGMFTAAGGSTDPVVDSLVTLPTQVFPAERLVLTALQVGAASLVNVRDVEITIDPKIDYDFNTGLPFPVAFSGAGAKGHLEVTMAIDADELDVGEGTGACSATFGVAAPNAPGVGATGLTMTLNSAWGVEEDWKGQQGEPVGRRLVVRTVHNGTTKPLTWGTF